MSQAQLSGLLQRVNVPEEIRGKFLQDFQYFSLRRKYKNCISSDKTIGTKQIKEACAMFAENKPQILDLMKKLKIAIEGHSGHMELSKACVDDIISGICHVHDKLFCAKPSVSGFGSIVIFLD